MCGYFSKELDDLGVDDVEGKVQFDVCLPKRVILEEFHLS